jgi:hypothetical protein
MLVAGKHCAIVIALGQANFLMGANSLIRVITIARVGYEDFEPALDVIVFHSIAGNFSRIAYAYLAHSAIPN